MKKLTESEIMQSERSISLLNLFHQNLQSEFIKVAPSSIPQNGGYHSPKRLFLSIQGVWRGAFEKERMSNQNSEFHEILIYMEILSPCFFFFLIFTFYGSLGKFSQRCKALVFDHATSI